MQLMRAALLATALLLPVPAASAQDEKEKQEIQITGIAGWAGLATRGDGTPALIDLDNRGKRDIDLVLHVVWAAGFASQSSPNPTLDGVFGREGPDRQIPVSLPAKSRKRISVTLLTPEVPNLSVWGFAYEKTGKILARGELPVRMADPQRRIVGVVGHSRPEGLADDHTVIAALQADELPEDWQGYGSLEALVWLDGRATELRSTAQVDALKRWISAGGRFYVARANTLNFSGTPIADLLPVKLGAGRELESLGENRFPVGPALVLENTPKSGIVRALAHGVPLVTEAWKDAGRVTFVAFDPARPPFSGSPQAPEFWKWLLQMGPLPAPDKIEDERAPAAIGSLTLSQYAGRFPDITAPEIGGLFLLIILYLVVVGPLDYLLLRWLKRLEYTWFTFPAYVVLFTLFILLVGGAFIKRSAHQREIVVEDHHADSGFVRRRALSAVLAPADIFYRIDEADPISSNHIDQQRSFGSEGSLTDVRLLPGPKPVADNWLLKRNYTGLALADRCDTAPSVLSYRITAQDGVSVQIAVKNTSTQTFEGSSLVTSKGVYWISSIPPGETQTTGSKTSDSLASFVEREGVKPVRRDRNSRYRGEEMPAMGITEQDLNPQVRKTLIGLSFAAPDGETETLTGFALGLQARRWIESGGSILCAWPAAAGPVVRFDPTPGRYTAVTMLRFFQGPRS